MNQGKYVFSQIMDFALYYQFHQCVKRYKGHHRVRSFTCWEHFLALAFGQLTRRESLRDIVVCLNAHQQKLYHLGFASVVTRSTLSDANNSRDWRIYKDFAEILIQVARKLYVNDKAFNLNLDGAVYVIDSSTIELCLNVFGWARLKKKRAAVRLHLQLSLQGNIPTFFHITSGKVHDIKFLDWLKIEPGAYYIMDRGYIDFERLFKIHQSGAFFIIRAKKNLRFNRLSSKSVDKTSGLRCDQVIELANPQMKKKYPDRLRRVKYFDKETNKHFVFLTNDFNLDAKVVADLYKYRWQIELFFKWIKQHLKIKVFWGYSENAVKTQICVAICVYLLIAIIKKQLKLKRNLYEILQILSVSPFDKNPLDKLISKVKSDNLEQYTQKQANLWGF